MSHIIITSRYIFSHPADRSDLIQRNLESVGLPSAVSS